MDEADEDVEVVSEPRGFGMAWGLIANAWGGDWSQAPTAWREAAERWRDEVWRPSLSSQRTYSVEFPATGGEKDQKITATCGHGHGELINLPAYGLRCPACFPQMFIDEVRRLREQVNPDRRVPRSSTIGDGVWVTRNKSDGEVVTVHRHRTTAETYASSYGLRLGFMMWGDPIDRDAPTNQEGNDHG